MKKKLNSLFMGTPNDVLTNLELLYQKTNLRGIITAPDRSKGRQRKQRTAPLPKLFAIDHDIPFRQTDNFKGNDLIELCQFTKNLNIDLIVIQAYGYIIPETFLKLANMDAINIHFSLLPKYRGASPIQAVLLNGEHTTGVTIQSISKDLDAGDILYQKSISIDEHDYFNQLKSKLIQLSYQCLDKFLDQYQQEQIKPQRQNHQEASYSKKIKKIDGQIDWITSFNIIQQKIKAYEIWPKSYTFYKGKRFIIHQIQYIAPSNSNSEPGTIIRCENNQLWIQCANAIVGIDKIQPENKGILSVMDFVNGYCWTKSDKLSN